MNDSMIKSTCYSDREPEFGSKDQYGGSQLSV